MFKNDAAAMTAWSREKSDGNPLTGDVAKELLGWVTEAELKDRLYESLPPEKRKGVKPEQVKIEGTFPILVYGGEPIYCRSNVHNRPFRPTGANDYKVEILRGKWRFNGESIIVDKFGFLHDGQHRLIGLLLAIQEWKEDAKLPKTDQKWQKLWPEEPYIESMVVLGIEADDETTNTIGCGMRRSLEDVIYRSPYFEDKPHLDKKRLSKWASWASKTLWERTSQRQISSAPRRPHSESMDFLARHERLLECVRFIYEEAKDKFTYMMPPGVAAGLMYLMAVSDSDPDEYYLVNSESALNFKNMEKAENFWVDFANNGKITEHLRDALLNIPEDAGGTFNSDLRAGLAIKSWLLYSSGRKITKDAIEVETAINGIGQRILAEHPRMGGIDVEIAIEEVKPEKKVEKPAKAEKSDKKDTRPKKEKESTSGECPHGGNHDYITDEDGSVYCAKCYEPKVIKVRK